MVVFGAWAMGLWAWRSAERSPALDGQRDEGGALSEGIRAADRAGKTKMGAPLLLNPEAVEIATPPETQDEPFLSAQQRQIVVAALETRPLRLAAVNQAYGIAVCACQTPVCIRNVNDRFLNPMATAEGESDKTTQQPLRMAAGCIDRVASLFETE